MEDKSTIVLIMSPEGETRKIWRIGDGDGRIVQLIPSDERSESFAKNLVSKIEKGHLIKEA